MEERISIVIPVYGCKLCLNELCFRIKATVKSISDDFEIILVNDASPDDCWSTILEIAARDTHVKGVNLSRNFGQHYAITAGLGYSSGDWIVVMDCDLQDKPEEIQRLHTRAKEGFDVVFGRRINRQDNFFKKLFSRLFYKVFDLLTENNTDNTISNFGIYSKQVIQNYLKFSENARIFPLLIKWQGFKIGSIDVEHLKRSSDKSSYSISKLLNLAFNVLISQSNKPLRFSIKVGFTMAFFSFIYLIILVCRKFIFDIPIGWTSIMVSIFFIGGLIFANLGLIGVYIGKIYDEVKARPLFLVKETIGEFHKYSHE